MLPTLEGITHKPRLLIPDSSRLCQIFISFFQANFSHDESEVLHIWNDGFVFAGPAAPDVRSKEGKSQVLALIVFDSD
jgi:hypothetical protein